MAEVSDHYALPLLQVGQAQKEVTHNEAVAGIDTLLHLAVESLSRSTPPSAPAAGQAWIVAASPADIWAGRAGEIASYGAGGWRYIAPQQGCVAWLRDVQRFAVFTADGWSDDGWPVAALRIGTRTALGGGLSVIAPPTGGAVVDTEARGAIAALIAGLQIQGLVAE